MSTNARRVENGEGKAMQAAYVYFIWGQPSDGAEGVVLGAFDVRKVYAPIVL